MNSTVLTNLFRDLLSQVPEFTSEAQVISYFRYIVFPYPSSLDRREDVGVPVLRKIIGGVTTAPSDPRTRK